MGKKPADKAKEIHEKAQAKPPKTAAKAKPAKKRVLKAKPKEHECQVKGCKREYRAKGYCRVHYKKWRHGEYGHNRYKICKDFECRKPMAMNRHGYCEAHYQNYYVKGMEVTKAPVAPKEDAAKTHAA